jgi:hypothetical protein
MLRTRNPATRRFMPGVFHEGRSVTQRESPVEHPCVSEILENHGRSTVTICVIRCWSPNSDRQRGLKYQASRQLFVLWSWGESKHRNLSRTSVWTASARGFNDVCLTGTPVSVWWCAFCAMRCATRRRPMAGIDRRTAEGLVPERDRHNPLARPNHLLHMPCRRRCRQGSVHLSDWRRRTPGLQPESQTNRN